jgi:hypothetical protein
MANCCGLSWFISGRMGKLNFVDRLLMFKGATMYRVEIDISVWGGDERVVIETCDFEKVQILQEFIDLQMEHGWAVEYDVITEDDLYEEEEKEDDEPSTISTLTIKIEE